MSEALRLADALDAHQFDEPHAAAAELRRQHEEITQLRHGAGVANQTIADLVAQRDQLLAALKLVAAQDQGCGGNVSEAEAWQSAQYIARAAIKAVEQ